MSHYLHIVSNYSSFTCIQEPRITRISRIYIHSYRGFPKYEKFVKFVVLYDFRKLSLIIIVPQKFNFFQLIYSGKYHAAHSDMIGAALLCQEIVTAHAV